MIANSSSVSGAKRTYSVADLYGEAREMLKNEVGNLRGKPLKADEQTKMDELAKLIANTVLKDMKVV